MQNTKSRLSIIAVAGILLLSLLCGGACTAGNVSSSATASEQGTRNDLVIVASFFTPYDFSRFIVGDMAEVSLLVPPGAEMHSYEPSPQDIMLLNSADVFIYAGGESDAWIERIIASLDNPDLVLIQLTDLVATLEEEELEGVETHSSHSEESDVDTAEEHEHEIDEHVWTSVRNSQAIVSSLAESFSELDPEHKQDFLANAEELVGELVALDEQFTAIVANAERNVLVFGDRFPFRYFAEDYGLTCYAAFPGCSTAVDTDPATISFLIDTVQEKDIPVVLYLELSTQRIARSISEETGAEPLLFHSVHNISKEDFDAGVTYVSLMQTNAENLERALN